ncbi:hypothetical protein Q5698_22765 (plasmid) [Brucella intermedia]|uniref:hypothetical protein n=1 Tax=Brucella intermedia TaxID=94625 RepID=UPI0027342699|nr:hypothetical protein [Brucella intermedia]WLF99785.1 hypothetical protein Q5698_22765 [Brucella intermedia]
MRSIAVVFTTSILAIIANSAQAESIPYGSRAGMEVTVVSKKGIGTSKAVIATKHTKKNAKEYCVGYEQDNSMACVNRTMKEIKLPETVSGNCKAKTWNDLNGNEFAFLGKHAPGDFAPDYAVKDLKRNEILDGSSASGYGTALAIFEALCPGVAK